MHERTIVLPEHRVLFVPNPKAACTSVLWILAELAGLEEDDFAGSLVPEASPILTVHDMSRWDARHRFAGYGHAERERMLADDDWLRFTLVRHPATRLWSAWQSKLLLREPRFHQTWGDAPWFPGLPQSPERIVADFRRFVAAVGAGDAEDVHWAPQRMLTDRLPLNHVGRVEDLGQTLERLRDHVGAAAWPDRPARENRTPLPLAPDAYDAAATAVLNARYADDFGAFGYAPLAPSGAPETWRDLVRPLLPLMRSNVGDRERVEQVLDSARSLRRRAQAAEAVASAAPAGGPALANREGHAEHTVRWHWSDAPAPGFTAVLRVRNEAASLPFSLPPLLGAVRRVVLVDNGSTDATVAVAQELAGAAGAGDRFEIHRYPYAVARCGAEHLATPADSVHSLAYFYNWAFSHVRTRYALKWDGDMVLSDRAVAILRDLEWQLEASETIVRIPRVPLYLGGDGRAFLDTGLRNCEPWAWPNRPGYTFVKAMEWELPLWGPDADTLILPEGSSLELKHLDADEFAHWSDTTFDRSARTRRKLREWQVFQALRDEAALPEGVVALHVPAGEDVVARAQAWLTARELEPAA